MNDVAGSRRPASRSPRRRGPAATPLGELRFSDWFETPIFEPDDDELMEEMATSGHGPRRLMARAQLARDARRAKRRPEWDAAEPVRAPGPIAKPAAAPAAKPAPAPVAKPAPAPAAKPAPVIRPARERELDAWATSGPAITDESMRIDLEKERPWRSRVSPFLDRWAEREVAVAARLDRSLERVLNPSLPEFLASAVKRNAPR